MVVPFQHLQIEVLRRPLETAQYTSIRYTDTLALEGLQPSIGSVGDAYDNAAAETVMGLFKNEAVAKDSPFRAGALKTETDVVEIVFEWVHSYNNQRLHSALDHQTPEEFEQAYYAREIGSLPDDAANKQRHDSRDGSPTHPGEPGQRPECGHCPHGKAPVSEKNASDLRKHCARGGTRTGLQPWQTLGTLENIPYPAQSGRCTTRSEAESVDSNDGIGCVAAWLQVWLTPCEGFVLTLICPPRHDRSKRGGQVDMTL
ncbi:integrase core domain-containing protein [Pseudarthrobacter sp. O4]|uniref:integrase core domain-containing protein n=1 Tax=Pseudarthrobacter sp. O4 TaxID=3418417 RepID=UPI003CF3FD6F